MFIRSPTVLTLRRKMSALLCLCLLEKYRGQISSWTIKDRLVCKVGQQNVLRGTVCQLQATSSLGCWSIVSISFGSSEKRSLYTEAGISSLSPFLHPFAPCLLQLKFSSHLDHSRPRAGKKEKVGAGRSDVIHPKASNFLHRWEMKDKPIPA